MSRDILIIAGSNFFSGAEFVLEDYLKGSRLRSRTVLLTSDTEEMRDHFGSIGLKRVCHSPHLGMTGAISRPTPRARVKKALDYARIRKTIRSILKDEEVSAVLGNNAGDCIYARHVKKASPRAHFVLHVHEMIDPASALGRVLRLFDRHVDEYIAVSEAVKAKLRETLHRGARVTVIYNGVDPAAHAPRRNLGEPRTIGFVGNLEENKDPQAFVDFLVGYVRSTGKNARGVMVFKHADPPLRHAVEHRIEEEGLSVDLRGSVDRSVIDGIYGDMDFLFVPFVDNSLPTVILEAFRRGTPVIGRRSGGIPELVRDGHNGFLYEGELRRVIDRASRLSQKEFRSMSRAALDTIRDGFTVDAKRDALDGLLSRLT
jgi:glycosyltransferase involved in cell wall biosynthesis